MVSKTLAKTGLGLRVAVTVACFAIGIGAAALLVGLTMGADRTAVLAAEPTPESPAPRFPVTVNRPAGPPRVIVSDAGPDGAPVTVACGTCHATRTPNRANRATADLDEFHQGLVFRHGTSTCLSCHDGDDYDRLRLADGRPVEFVDVMTLCSQCHGPQFRDWQHGAHGGMSGYWDLSRGPRARNNCVDCHDPHAPAFPMMRPTFKPIDRFLTDLESH